MKELIEKFTEKYKAAPLAIQKVWDFDKDLWELINGVITNDREHIFEEIAIQMWDTGMEDEDGNPNDRDMEIGYDENGLPNSVGLSIYGRTHSEISFTPNKDIQNLKDK